jgi:hypothetical protein
VSSGSSHNALLLHVDHFGRSDVGGIDNRFGSIDDCQGLLSFRFDERSPLRRETHKLAFVAIEAHIDPMLKVGWH